MAPSYLIHRTWQAAFWRLVGVVALAGLGVLVVFFARDFQTQFVRLATADSQNGIWAISQAEVELVKLNNEVLSLKASDEPDPEQLRLRFDIFYSGMDTILTGRSYEYLRNSPLAAEGARTLEQTRTELVALIDRPDDVLLNDLDLLDDRLKKASVLLHQMSVGAIQVLSAETQERRNALLNTIVRLGVLAATLILTLLVTVFGLLRLNTEMRRANLAQRLTRARLEAIVATSQDAIVVTNVTGRIIEFNPAAVETLGYGKDEAIGQNMADLLVPDQFVEAHSQGMARYRQTGEARVIGHGIVQLEAKRKDGTIIPIDLTLDTAETDTGRIFVSFLRDISDRVAKEKELMTARDQAIAGERSKAELLAVMSHEMRTPLNGILGTLELIDTSKLPKENQRHCKIIRKSSEILLKHVNDVLDVSRLDAGKMDYQARPFDLVELLQDIIDSLESRADEHNTQLIMAPPHPALRDVASDPDRLQQIMLNLLSNAVKFTFNGSITVETELIRDQDAVTIRVIDTGIGIPEEEQERIFGDFETIDTTYARQNSGSGLGLGIVKRLVTILGGEIGVDSEPGQGSVFWVHIPLGATEIQDACADDTDQSEPQEPVQNLSILMVEDNEINRTVARSMLELDNHNVIEASDGKMGLDKAKAIPVDIILMDISMPELDGMEASRLIRSNPGPNQDVPIIATTAHAMDDEIKEFRKAGMTDVLIKPLTIASLRSVLARQHGALFDVSEAGGSDAPHSATIDTTTLDTLAGQLSEDIVHDMYQQFRAEGDAFFKSWPDTYDADTRVALAAAGHKLAGSAAVLGAVALRQALNTLEEQINDRDPADLNADRDALEQCWYDTWEALEPRTMIGAA